MPSVVAHDGVRVQVTVDGISDPRRNGVIAEGDKTRHPVAEPRRHTSKIQADLCDIKTTSGGKWLSKITGDRQVFPIQVERTVFV